VPARSYPSSSFRDERRRADERRWWPIARLTRAGEGRVAVGPLCCTPVRNLDFTSPLSHADLRQLVFVAELWHHGERLSLALGSFVPNKHLALVEPGLECAVQRRGDQLLLDLRARSLARFVELQLDGADVIFGDNYFDAPAGRTLRVTAPLPEGWSLDRARAALKVRSLYDSFA
jgi:beta-mannosidase